MKSLRLLFPKYRKTDGGIILPQSRGHRGNFQGNFNVYCIVSSTAHAAANSNILARADVAMSDNLSYYHPSGVVLVYFDTVFERV